MVQPMNPLRKVEKLYMPLRQKGTKFHKELIINYISLVKLSVFVPSWQNLLFGMDSSIKFLTVYKDIYSEELNCITF